MKDALSDRQTKQWSRQKNSFDHARLHTPTRAHAQIQVHTQATTQTTTPTHMHTSHMKSTHTTHIIKPQNHADTQIRTWYINTTVQCTPIQTTKHFPQTTELYRTLLSGRQ